MNQAELPVDVVVGAIVYRKGFYMGEKFLANQKEIQKQYPSSELVLATNELDFIPDLEKALKRHEIRSRVLHYTTVGPDYAKTYVWNIASGRETIRQFVISHSKAEHLLWVDSDMTFDAGLINILKENIRGYGVIYSGYALRFHGLALTGGGCCLLTREVFQRFKYKCYEFRNGFGITDDMALEFDLLVSHVRIKKGFFLNIHHYDNNGRDMFVAPRRMGFFRVTQSSMVRYAILKSELLTHRGIGTWLRVGVYKVLGALKLTPYSS
jgi:hypothetical protein